MRTHLRLRTIAAGLCGVLAKRQPGRVADLLRLVALAAALSGGTALAAPLYPTELLSSTALPGAWDTRFGSVSAPGPVTINAFAVAGGNVFAGGVFTNLGGVTATNLARWDGSSWTNIGNGFDGPVYALAWDGTNHYVGGQFNTADTVGATNIAKWNGKAWSGLDTGFDGPVYAIAVAGTNLIAGGAFANASGAGMASGQAFGKARSAAGAACCL